MFTNWKKTDVTLHLPRTEQKGNQMEGYTSQLCQLACLHWRVRNTQRHSLHDTHMCEHTQEKQTLISYQTQGAHPLDKRLKKTGSLEKRQGNWADTGDSKAEQHCKPQLK